MSHGRVIVVGSVNVDLVMRLPVLPSPGQTVLGGVLGRHDGGKGANQAVAAARAGAQVCFVGTVGAADGQPPVDALAAEGIDVTAIQQAPGERTGHAFVLVRDDGSGENQIAVASGANALVSSTQVTTSLAALRLTAADVVVGSFEVPAEALTAASQAAAASGSALVVNPAPVLPRSLDVLHGAIATPNAGELAIIIAELGLPGGEPAAAAGAVARHNGAPVVVTLGPAGALLADGTHAEHISGYQVDVADTTGAGDTFTGVLAASLAAGQPLAACVGRAVAASALAVTRQGARAGMPTAAAIDALLAARATGAVPATPRGNR